MHYATRNWKETFLISAILISFAIVFHGLLVHGSATLEKQTAQNAAVANEDGTFIVSTTNAPIWGKKDAPVTIIEFSDYDCPFCTKAYKEILPQLKEDYIDDGKLRFMYRNAPLEQHKNAKTKATAALCAKKLQGDDSYYQFHNQLYDNAESSMQVNELLTSIANKTSLNVQNFNACLKNEQLLRDQIDLDIAEAYQLGANGTPTWFIGKTNKKGETIKGIRVVGTQPYSVYRILINQLLQS